MKESVKRWLVLEIVIAREFEEAVSNFLFEHGATGIEELDGDAERKRLRAYFLREGKKKRVVDVLRRYLKSLNRLFPANPATEIRTTVLTEQNWGESWKRFFKPVQVTPKFLVKPPWSKPQPKTGQMPIDITPGMAFGTGTHPTTILCIQALEERLRKRGRSVLDMGTGSGILSIIAAKLGAKEVWGIDTDGMAVENARENVEKNCVSDIVKLRKGSIGILNKRFDVVVANIDLKNLKKMKKSLANRVKHRGFLILSGILKSDQEEIYLRYLESGRLRRVKTAQKDEWVCVTFRRK